MSQPLQQPALKLNPLAANTQLEPCEEANLMALDRARPRRRCPMCRHSEPCSKPRRPGADNDRMAVGVAVLGAIGGIGSVSAALGSTTAVGIVGSWFFLLSIGSTAVALDLSRHGTMPRSLAIVHAVAAFAVVVIIFAIWTTRPLAA